MQLNKPCVFSPLPTQQRFPYRALNMEMKCCVCMPNKMTDCCKVWGFTQNMTFIIALQLCLHSRVQGRNVLIDMIFCSQLWSLMMLEHISKKCCIKNSICSQSYETSLASGETFPIISQQPKQLPLCHNFQFAAHEWGSYWFLLFSMYSFCLKM